MDFLERLRTNLDEKDKKKPANRFQLRDKWTSPELIRLTIGAGGRNRTDMELPPLDFESSASTSFTTPAFEQLQQVASYHKTTTIHFVPD